MLFLTFDRVNECKAMSRKGATTPISPVKYESLPTVTCSVLHSEIGYLIKFDIRVVECSVDKPMCSMSETCCPNFAVWLRLC